MSDLQKVFEAVEFKKIKEAYEEVGKAYEDGFQFSDLRVYVGTLAIAIEQCSVFVTKSGVEKKELLVGLLVSAIQLPKWIPGCVKTFIFNLIISFVIDSVIKLFNKKGWNLSLLKD